MSTWAEGLRHLPQVTQGSLWTVKSAALKVSIQYSTTRLIEHPCWPRMKHVVWRCELAWYISHRTGIGCHWNYIKCRKPLWINVTGPGPALSSSGGNQYSLEGSTAKAVVTLWYLLANADSLMMKTLEISPTWSQQDKFFSISLSLKVTKTLSFLPKRQLLHKELWSTMQVLINIQILLIYTHTHMLWEGRTV